MHGRSPQSPCAWRFSGDVAMAGAFHPILLGSEHTPLGRPTVGYLCISDSEIMVIMTHESSLLALDLESQVTLSRASVSS